MKLRYTPRALAELDQILAYIAARSQQGAKHVRQRLDSVVTRLAQHPYSGSQTSVSRLRRISVSSYPYVIFYEVTEKEVVIIGVRHAARRPIQNPGRA